MEFAHLISKQKYFFRSALAALLILFGSTTSAGLFDNDIRVRKFLCDGTTGKPKKGDYFVVTYVVEKNTVFTKTEFTIGNEVLGKELDKLEPCQILDKRNWKCGGETSIVDRNLTSVFPMHQVVDGKYYFVPGSTNFKPWKDQFCKYEQLN